MPQLLQPNSAKPRKKRVSLFRAGIFAVAAACAAASVDATPAARAAIAANATTLPLDSSVFFVLDDTISSHAKAGTIVRAHLRDPIVLGGVTVAPAGATVQIEITQTSAAQMGNVDGYAEIFFQPLPLPGGKSLPLVTPTSHLDPHTTAGQQSTQAVTDTVGDIFIPYHVMYHVLRKGSDVTLKPGTVIRTRTGATLEMRRGQLAVIVPPPIVKSVDTPRPAFVPAPLDTPPGYIPPTPKPTPSVAPTHTP
ncbi:MAG TPA: hypothetical protein VGZ02_00755 [Candidatus Baltobacteraceae bacterium]|nr:hypothetical protein [Candidatus Baltobacteraceae bacterium]